VRRGPRWGSAARASPLEGLAERRVYPIATGAGGAGPGASVERARATWVRMGRTTAGSCTMAMTRRRPGDWCGEPDGRQRPCAGRILPVRDGVDIWPSAELGPLAAGGGR
jgi:hypothetical protein